MKPPELDKLTVKKLRDHLLSRRFAVPKLQRNFVWDPGRAAKLLDSMYRDMPIGSLFLWEMDRKSANLIRQSAEVLPSFDDRHARILFVIDGQQRLSVIHQAFEGDKKTNDAGREIDFGRLCFAVSPDSEQDDPARVVYRKPDGRQYVPIKDILAENWKKRMPIQSRMFMSKIRSCRERLLNYPLPVITVRSATLNEIGEVFIRINAQGMKITSADRAVALMGKLDVRHMAQELRQKVRDKVFAISAIDPILMGFNLVEKRPSVDSDPPKLETMARQWSKRIERNANEKGRFRRLWDKYQKAFLLAVDYLHRRFPVFDETYLPSANMLATLSVFFFYHRGQPDKHQSTQIRKWFWTTGVAERYSGRGYHRNIVSDARLFESLGRGSKNSFVFRDRLDPVIDIRGAEYASRSARTRVFFCLLASLGPRYLDNGDTIALQNNVVSHANRRDRHHIFPKGQLSFHFPAKVYNSLCNICFLVARDNQSIGKRRPRIYLAGYRDRNRREFRRIMKSHLIPVAEDSGIWDRGIIAAFKRFRESRLKLICAEFEKAAGMKLFRKN